MYTFGDKVEIQLPGVEDLIPGIVESAPFSENVTSARTGRTIPVQKVWVTSLRTVQSGPDAGKDYITVTAESIRFLTSRFGVVEGLDHIDGKPLTRTDREQLRAQSNREQQASRAASAVTL